MKESIVMPLLSGEARSVAEEFDLVPRAYVVLGATKAGDLSAAR